MTVLSSNLCVCVFPTLRIFRYYSMTMPRAAMDGWSSV